MRVVGEADGRFDAGDAIEFLRRRRRLALHRHERLLAGGRRLARPAPRHGRRAREQRRAALACQLLVGAAAQGSEHLLRGAEERRRGELVRADRLRRPARRRDDGGPRDHAATAPAQLTVTLQGVTNAADGNNGHYVSVMVNGVAVGEVDVRRSGEQLADAAGAGVRARRRRQHRHAPGAQRRRRPEPGRRCSSLSYRHTYQRRQRHAASVGGSARPDHHRRLRQRGDPRRRRHRPGEPVRGARHGEDRRQRLLVDAPSARPVPRARCSPSRRDRGGAGVRRRRISRRTGTPRRTRTTTSSISHGDFVEQVRPLVEAREAQGITPRWSTSSDIYDEFSFGEKTPQAIRDFLQFGEDDLEANRRSSSSWSATRPSTRATTRAWAARTSCRPSRCR